MEEAVDLTRAILQSKFPFNDILKQKCESLAILNKGFVNTRNKYQKLKKGYKKKNKQLKSCKDLIQKEKLQTNLEKREMDILMLKNCMDMYPIRVEAVRQSLLQTEYSEIVTGNNKQDKKKKI